MKYFNIPALRATITRIRDGNITHEHCIGTAGLGLTRNYFPLDKFAITSEQIQEFTRKKPDFSMEKFLPSSSTFIPHCFVEIKSIIGRSINNIPDQLFDTIFVTMDDFGFSTGGFSVFMLAMKGTKISFYVYNSFGSLLDDHGIVNYTGFIPLNELIPHDAFISYYGDFPLGEQAYEFYTRDLVFETDPGNLRSLGVKSTEKIRHPHVFDLLNEKHRDHIHSMFRYFSEKDPNKIFRF